MVKVQVWLCNVNEKNGYYTFKTSFLKCLFNNCNCGFKGFYCLAKNYEGILINHAFIKMTCSASAI